jgi:queuine tRNA-ribosyltransferase
LQRTNEILGARLNTIHNLFYYLELMRTLRQAIIAGTVQRTAEQLRRARSQLAIESG